MMRHRAAGGMGQAPATSRACARVGRACRAAERSRRAIKQMPEVAEVARGAALAQMRVIDGFIAGRRFITGERYTIADITAMVALRLGAVVGLTVDPGLANLTRWYGEVSVRPSARA